MVYTEKLSEFKKLEHVFIAMSSILYRDYILMALVLSLLAFIIWITGLNGRLNNTVIIRYFSLIIFAIPLI